MRKLLALIFLVSVGWFSLPPLYHKLFTPVSLSDIPSCSADLTPVDHVNCRAELVTKLDALTRQTQNRALYLTGNKAALSDEFDLWEDKNVKPCKDDTCLETAYLTRLSALYRQPYTLQSVIDAGLFSDKPLLGAYNFNWPIIVTLGLLCIVLALTSLALLAYARDVAVKLQAAQASPPPAASASSAGPQPSPNSGGNTQSPPPPADDEPAQEWHEVLQVSKDAPFDEVKKAWKRLAAVYHPDKVAHLGDAVKAEAEKMMTAINAAFQAAKKVHGVT